MIINSTNINKVTIELAEFGSPGGAAEMHLVFKPFKCGTIEEQLSWIEEAYNTFLSSKRISIGTAVLKRFFVSDLINQVTILENHLFSTHAQNNYNCAVSYVEQPPLPDNKVVLWSYHIVDNSPFRQIKQNSITDMILERNGYKHIWSMGLSDISDKLVLKQTETIFHDYKSCLEKLDLELNTNVIRTWLYIQNIDTNYQDVVTARKDFFSENGLTENTHYITSTGIEGRYKNSDAKVFMDAYAVGGISEKQVQFLKAPDHLNPTHQYGVTFERGVAVDYGDRRHIFIAGTASIDNKGQILHKGNVLKQLERVIENISALLEEADSDLSDIAHMVVYLRDHADYDTIENYLIKHLSSIPKVIVLAPVCRPGWLVEIECIAIKTINNSSLNNF